MRKLDQILLLMIVIGLTGCSLNTPVMTEQPSVTNIQPPAVLNVITPTPAPSATATEMPTQTATPGLPLFTDDEIKSQVDRLAATFLKSTRNPGLSIAIVTRNPQTGLLEAMLLNYGVTFKDGKQTVTSDTVYEIGSITKVFTGIMLAEAVNSGTVKLDDPIQNYLPHGVHAPTYRDIPITLSNLATHRSALPRDSNSDNLEDLYIWLNSYQLSHAPNSQYVYSNLGYSLLGDILAQLSGSDYSTLEYQSVSQPLGLIDTSETLSDDQRIRLAQGYRYDGSLAPYFPESGTMSSAGYLHSTLTDMTRFLIANMQPDSTPLASSLKLAQTMQAEGRNPGTGSGLGWEIDQPGKPNERISKGGGTPGFTSYISFAKDGSSGFVLLSNGQYVETLVPAMVRLLSENAK